MPYSIRLPDGTLVENIPDEVTPQQAKARIAASRPDLAPKVPTRSSGEAVADVGLSLGQGAVGAFKALSDIAGADNVVSRGLGATSEFLGSKKSEQSRAIGAASAQRIREAEASDVVGSEVKAYLDAIWDQPVEMLAQAAGSFATLGIGKAAQAFRLMSAAKAAGTSKAAFLATDAGKAAAKAAAEVGFRTNIGVGAGMGLGAVKGSQYEQTYRNALQQGMGEDQARALAEEAQAYGGAGTGQQLLGAGLGALASATGPIERVIAGRPGQAAGSIPAQIAKGFAVEGATEGTQGAQERYAGNVAAIDAGVLDPAARFRGVAGQFAQEGLLGGVLGGAAGVMGQGQERAPASPATGSDLQRELEARVLAARQGDETRRAQAAADAELLQSGDYTALEQRKQELLQDPTPQNKAAAKQIQQAQAALNTQALAARRAETPTPAPAPTQFEQDLTAARGLPTAPEQSAFAAAEPQQIEIGGFGRPGQLPVTPETPPSAPTPAELEAAGQQRLPLRRTAAGLPTTVTAPQVVPEQPAPSAAAVDENIPEPTLRKKPEPAHPALTKEAIGGRALNWANGPKGREFVGAITAMSPEQVQNLREEYAKNPDKDKNRQAVFNAIYPETTGSDVRPESAAVEPAVEPGLGVPVPSEPAGADTAGVEPSDGAGVAPSEPAAGPELDLEGDVAPAVSPFAGLLPGAQAEAAVEPEAEPEVEAPAARPSAFTIPKRSLFDQQREAEAAREETGGIFYKGDAYRTVEPQAAPSTPVSDAELRKVLGKVTKALGLADGAGVIVLDSVSQIDPSEAPGSRSGAVIDGQAYLFRDGIADGVEGQKSVFHELLHKGLRVLFSPAEYVQQMTSLDRQSADIRARVDKWLEVPSHQADMQKAAPGNPKMQRALAVDEVLAEMAEIRKPPNTVRQLGNWLAGLADKMGLPQLAKSIRTMGRSPLEAFVDAALRAAGGQIQAAYTAPAYRTAPFKPATDFEKIVSTAAISQGKPSAVSAALGKVAKAFETSAEVTVGDRFRTLTVDNMATVERRINNLFDGAVRSSTGMLNPMGLNRQAQDVGKLLIDWFADGALTKDPSTGTYTTVKVAGQPAMQDVIAKVQAWADSKGMPLDRAQAQVSKMLEARRLDDLRRANAAGTGDFKINKLSNADPRSADEQIDIALAELQANPEVLAIAQDMNAVRATLIDELVQVGRLTPEQGQLWKDNIAYVPLDRIAEFEETFKNVRRTGGGIAQLGRLPQLKGSERREAGDVLSNFTNTAGWMMHQIVKQDATANTLQMLEQMGYATKLKPTARSQNPELTVSTFEAGRPVSYELPSRWDVLAFRDLAAPKSAIVQMLSGFSNMLRTTITSMPPFAVRQVINDIQRAFITSGVQNPYQMIAPALRNFGSIAFSELMGKRHPSVKKFGQIGIVGDFDINTLNPMESIMYDLGFKARGPLRGLLHRLQGITRASDLAVRMAVYDQTIKESGDALLAQTRARELINFRRRGASSVVGAATATIPFFNAYLQGMDVLYRAISGKGASASVGRAQARKLFASKVATMAAFATIYAMLVSGTDEYDDRGLRERNNNWIIPGVGKLPVPEELGAIFKVPAEMVLEYMRRRGTAEDMEASEAAITALKYAYEQYIGRVTPVPAAIKPVLEAFTNFSFFTGQQLEGTYQRGLLPSERTATNSSELAKAIAQFTSATFGETFTISPIKIDNFLQGYFGTVAGLVTMGTDQAINPDRMDRPIQRYWMLSNFLYDPVGTRRIEEFYTLREKVVPKLNTLNRLAATDPERAEQFAQENEQDLILAQGINAALRRLSETRKYKQYLASTVAAQDMSQEERSQELQAVREAEVEVVGWLREARAMVRDQ